MREECVPVSASMSESHTHIQVELWDTRQQAGRLYKSVFPHPRDAESLSGGGYFIFILSV